MLRQDLRYTVRMLRRAPLFTLSVVTTLALGIGATTAIFSVVNAVILRPLPFPASDRLVWIAERNDRLNLPRFAASAANYLSWKQRSRAFEEMGAIGFGSFNLGGDGQDAEQLAGGRLTPSVFAVLGLQPVTGRAFRAGDDVQGAPRVAMISEALWRRRFANDPAIIGRHIKVNTLDVEIVGIAPAALTVVTQGDLWTALNASADPRPLNHVVFAIGRRAPGVTLDQAQAELDGVMRAMGVEVPEIKDWGVRLVTFTDWIIGNQLVTSLWVLFGAVGCVLLIACANVANLLLSRAVGRERELALRTSIGATRGRLLTQLLVESVVLASIGGAVGLAYAAAGVRLVNVLLPPGVLPVPSVTLDVPVMLFAAGISIATGLLFGLAPAWSMTRGDVHTALKQSSRSATGGRRWVRATLAAGELALATVLLVGAGLLGQSLFRLQQQPIGFDADRLLTFQVSPPIARYPLDSKAPIFYSSLVETLAALPGVTGAAVSSGLPLGTGNYTTTPMMAVGESIVPADTPFPIDWRIVSPDFFRVMGVPVVSGRLFTESDRGDAGNVMLVSEATARRFWGDANPIGRVIRRVADGRETSVIGVVGDVRNRSVGQESPAVYYPSARYVWPRMDVVVKTTGDPTALVSAVRQAVRQLDPDIPISNVRTQAEYVSANSAQPRLNAILLGIFSVVAIVIAAIGVYGILAYSVNQRTREIGLRMALGASRRGVIGLVVREGMTVGIAGIVAGVGGALALGRTIASLLFGVPAYDPATLLTVTALLTAVSLAACAVPAAKASRVEPQVALKGE